MKVLCCADEAALCARCDRDVHAGKHHRLPLILPADVSAPNCDICQEAHAYFFCVEDRALLCRACDVAVHTANAFVSAHRRFLLTGVQVGLQPDAEASDPRAQGGRSRALQRPAGRRPAAGGWVDGNEVDLSVPSWSLEDKRSAGRAFQLGTGAVSQVSSGADG